MDPVTSSVLVARAPLEVFEYLGDVANHAEFTDRFTDQWHLTREDSYGRGAGARFHLKMRRNRFGWMDMTVAEFVPPRRIVLVGRAGKYNRIRAVQTFELEPVSGSSTRVHHSFETQPKLPTDRFFERRGFFKRSWKRSMKRLQAILEGEADPGRRATIAGGPRKPATGSPIR